MFIFNEAKMFLVNNDTILNRGFQLLCVLGKFYR